MPKCIYKLTMLLLMLTSLTFPQRKVNMEDAVNIALENNYKIKQYNERVEQKNFKDLESWGNFLPQINISGSYNHLNDPIVFDLEPVRQAIMQIQSSNQVEFANIYTLLQGKAPLTDQQRAGYYSNFYSQLSSQIPLFQETMKKQDYMSASFTAVQPLFMGGKLIAAKKYAAAELASANVEFAQTKIDVTSETIQNYLNVVFISEVVKVRQDVLDGIIKHRNKAKKMLDEGLIANYNVLRAEVAVSEAEKNLASDKNKLKLSMIALKTSMGVDLNEDLTVNDSLVYLPLQDSLNQFVSQALDNNPILKLISYKKEAAEQNYNVERSNFLPVIAAFGKYELYPQYLSILEPRWVVGVQASFNIFNGFKDYSKLQTANHLEKEVAYLELDTKKKIELLINKNYIDVMDASDRYDKGLTTITLARENLRLNDKRFETGLGTSLEVVDAELSLERANIDNKSSIYDYYKSLSELYKSTGEPEKLISVWKSKGN